MLWSAGMKTTLTKQEHNQHLITLNVEEADLAEYKDKAAKELSHHVNVPGFRPGTAPTFAVISHVGAEAFRQEVIDQALPHLYYKAIMEHKIEPIAAPRISLKSKEPIVFEAIVATMPTVKVKDIEKLKHEQIDASVTDKEVDEVIKEMLKMHATFKPLEGAVEKGDKLEIAFKGFDEGGVELENTVSKNHPLFVGEGQLIPGFEDNLIGMKVGDKKKFPITFPKDYGHKPFQSKNVTFEVEVLKGDKPVFPEFDEVLVEKLLGKKDTKENLLKIIKEDLSVRKKQELRKQREGSLMDKMVENADVDVPPILIDEEVDYMMADLKERFEKQGGSYEKLMESLAKKGKDQRKEYAEEATKRVKIRLILNHLFNELKIEVSDDDMQKAGTTLLAQAPEAERENVKKQLDEKKGIYLRLKNNLMLEKLITHFIGE